MKRIGIGLALLILIGGVAFLAVNRTDTPNGQNGQFKTSGTIAGTVSVGPLCPVEPCNRDMPDLFKNVQVVLTPKGGGRSVDLPFHFSIDPNGSFGGEVPESNYEITLSPCEWMGCRSSLPKMIRVEANKTIEVTIDIDTGIR